MKPFIVIAALGLCACGNYSNEDLDFQLSLPEDGELEAKLPQALTLDNSAEYYLLTRKVVVQFNGMAVALVSLVDHVRQNSPTSRHGAERIWGPFSDDQHPGWQMRMVMQRIEDPAGLKIAYNFQIRDLRQNGSIFFDLLTGSYVSSGNARRGEGDMHLLVDEARTAGYPVDDLGELVRLDLNYQTREYPITVDMVVENVPISKTPKVVYHYSEDANGAGQLKFDWTVDAASAIAGSTTIMFVSRWLGSGAGRADARTASGLRAGTDCWSPNTVADYVHRWGQTDLGTDSLCVFGDPVF
jgi:hypothetical protein